MNKPKYEIGQRVWRLDKITHQADKEKVRGIAFGSVTLKKEQWLYCVGFGMIDNCNRWYSENELFPTKQDLINSL